MRSRHRYTRAYRCMRRVGGHFAFAICSGCQSHSQSMMSWLLMPVDSRSPSLRKRGRENRRGSGCIPVTSGQYERAAIFRIDRRRPVNLITYLTESVVRSLSLSLSLTLISLSTYRSVTLTLASGCRHSLDSLDSQDSAVLSPLDGKRVS